MRRFGDPAASARSRLSHLSVRLPRDWVGGERSDIDIGIEGPAPVPHPALAAIHDELEEAPTLFTIDVVDFRRVPEKFRKVAQQRIPL